MTPSAITALISRHVNPWYEADKTPVKTLRECIADAVAEAIAITDKNWQDGNATLRHERDVAQAKVASLCASEQTVLAELQALRQARDDAVAACHLMQEGR